MGRFREDLFKPRITIPGVKVLRTMSVAVGLVAVRIRLTSLISTMPVGPINQIFSVDVSVGT
jgi:hypothetical protein